MRPIVVVSIAFAALTAPALADQIEVGVRPTFLVGQMPDSPLRDKLAACADKPLERKLFSIAHRGAPLQFPEHTAEGYRAGALMGAGIIECDVTFTKDKQLVCRHAQNDLHTTTNILATDLAAKCTAPFHPANGDQKAGAECRTSDLTLAEFRTLHGKMDAGDPKATTVEAFMDATAPFRTDLYAADGGTLMTHAESIQLLKSLGAKFTPELKEASVEMPFDGFTQADYAQKMIDEYKAADIPPSAVYPQSFHLDDVLYWIQHEPEFGAQAILLVDPDTIDGFDNRNPATWGHDMAELKRQGVNYIAPPIFVLLSVENGEIVPSPYAHAAKDAGLKMITWSLERSGPLNVDGGGWYYQSIGDAIHSDGDMYKVVDVLTQQVGVSGIFSDWPATVSYYANCMDLD